MVGNPPHLVQTKDFKDPFNAGQMIGMLVMLTFIEQNHGITEEALNKIRWICANNAQHYLEKPTEDIFLMVESIVKEIGKM